MILLHIASLFYLLTGLYAAKTLLQYDPLERALDLIGNTTRPFWVRHQMTWLACGSLIIVLSAFLALLRLDLALYVALIAVLQQAVYFWYLAPRHIDPIDPPDPNGRRSSQGAFLGFGLYTLALAWCVLSGRMRGLSNMAQGEMLVLIAGLIAWLGYALWLLWPRSWR